MRKAPVYVLSVLLAAAVILAGLLRFEPDDSAPLAFLAVTANAVERLRFVEREPGECDVFLPSYLSLRDLHISTKQPVTIDGRPMGFGSSCKSLEPNTTYSLSGVGDLNSITFFQAKGMPTLHLETGSGGMEYIQEKKGNEEPGKLRLYTEDGELNARGSLNFIKARGNTTFTYTDKKSYSLELSREQDLLGMGRAKKWILLADAFDPSHLRNKIVYDFAGAVGLRYCPDSRWVDLYLNGEYAGLYLLTERNEIHPSRVDIDPAGFLVSSEAPDRMEGLPHITLKSGTVLRIHQSGMDESQLESLWQSAERAIAAADGVDPSTGKHWRELLDVDSWARKYLVEEIFGNHDGGRLSQFYYYEDGKIFAGPVWDYDYAIANRDIYEAPVSNMFYVNQPYERHGSKWFGKLYGDPAFYERVTELYRTQCRPVLEALVERKIFEYGETVSRAAYADRILWDTDSPGEETAAIQMYLSGRMEFLDRVWVDKEPYLEVSANFNGRWANYILFPGDTLPPLPQREGCSWYIAGTDERLDESQPVFESMEIELLEVPAADEKE
ncbi:MAG: CotH kinase family protein [Eubacteriales bacterium]|nr:CotH kinase family protein [Eubacteriales bacterium]